MHDGARELVAVKPSNLKVALEPEEAFQEEQSLQDELVAIHARRPRPDRDDAFACRDLQRPTAHSSASVIRDRHNDTITLLIRYVILCTQP